MSASVPVSPAIGRRSIFLSPTNISSAHASPTTTHPRHVHAMTRASQTSVGNGAGSASRWGDTARVGVHDIPRRKPERRSAPSEEEPDKMKQILMDEITRLTASCEAHERELRVSQTTINRQLQDWSQNFDTLNELDNQAERMTVHIHNLIATTQTDHSEKISAVIDAPEKEVEALQSRLEPWTTYIQEHEEDIEDLDAGVMGIKGIPRIKREKAPLDGLAKLEQQADIVKSYYEAEQARLNALLQAKRGKRRLFTNILWFTSSAALIIGIVIWFLLWMFEWRHVE